MNEALRNFSKAEIPEAAKEEKMAELSHRIELIKKFVQIKK